MAAMPMFPLGTPLLPGGVLPLHVFEPRYRQMIRDVLAGDSERPAFGVALIERGHEVGGGDQRSMVGTIAVIREIEVTADGRYVLVAVGTERLRVRAWLPDDPYPQADVEVWPDDDSGNDRVDAGVIADLHDAVRALVGIAREAGHPTPPADSDIAADRRLAVYQLGSLAPLGPADRQRLLAASTLADRIEVLREVIEDAMAVWEFRRS